MTEAEKAGSGGRRRLMVWLLSALSAAALALLLLTPRASGPRGSGSAAPERNCGSPTQLLTEGLSVPHRCTVEQFEGGTSTTLAEVQGGRPMVLNFWASWCPSCIGEMPEFQQVYESLAGRVEFVGVDVLGVRGETRAAARRFARETGVRYPLVFDEKGVLHSRFVGAAGLAMPVTILVQADGTIVHGQAGPLRRDDLRALIEEKLTNPAGG